MAIEIPDAELTVKRHEIVDRHMTHENAHEFEGAIDAFTIRATRSSPPARSGTAPTA